MKREIIKLIYIKNLFLDILGPDQCPGAEEDYFGISNWLLNLFCHISGIGFQNNSHQTTKVPKSIT